ncbi:unnamed protein product, partial [Prunus brigantina]
KRLVVNIESLTSFLIVLTTIQFYFLIKRCFQYLAQINPILVGTISCLLSILFI